MGTVNPRWSGIPRLYQQKIDDGLYKDVDCSNKANIDREDVLEC